MADWLDQVDTTPPKPAAPGGASGDWLEQVDTTPPDWRSTPTARNITTGVQVGALSGIRALLGIPDFISSFGPGLNTAAADQVSAETGGNYSGEEQKKFVPAQPTLPSELVIKGISDLRGLPLELGADAPQWAKTTEGILPWLIPTGATAARVREAPGLIGKGVTAATSTAGGVADWLLSDAGQAIAQQQGWGPVATQIASMLATQVRHVPGHVVSGVEAVKKGRGYDTPLIGNAEAGETYDANRAIGVQPPIEDVAGEKLRSTASALSASKISGTGSNVAKDLQREGVIKTADKGIQAISPDAPSIAKGAPSTLNDYAEDLSTRAREQVDTNRIAAAAESERLEAPIKTAPIDAAPTLQELTKIVNDKDNYGIDSRATAEKLLDRFNKDVDPATGMISFAAMKQQRENFKEAASQLYPIQTGVATTSRSVGHDISPVEKAMTDGMVSVAGPDWAKNDAKWTQNSRELRNLQPITGKQKKVGEWKSPPGSAKVAKNLKGAVGGNTPVLDELERGMPGESRRATGEVIASLGTPQGGTGSGKFRPDLFATDYPKGVSKGMRERIKKQGPVGPRGPEPPGRGAEALENLDKAAAVSRGTVRERKPGGLEETLGALGRVGTFAHEVGGMGVAPAVAALMGGPVGLGGALAARTLLPRLLNDPSFVRLVAGRRFTADNIAGILAQYAQRAGLAATGPRVPIQEVGKSAMSALQHLPKWTDVPGVSQLLKRF